MKESTLAFYIPYGNEVNAVEYSETDLLDPAVLKLLFDYCQILEGHITYVGWMFLLKQHGYERLYEIDKESGWFDSASLEQFIEDINFEISQTKESESDMSRSAALD